MPDRDVTTIKDLIYYQYAKIIACSALHAPDGTAGICKKLHQGDTKERFKAAAIFDDWATRVASGFR